MNSIINGTIVVTFLTLLSKVLGFFRDLVIANSFGATWATDSYNITITITNIIYSVIGIAISSSIIPLISKVDRNNEDKEIGELCSNVINFFIPICLVIIIVVYIFTNEIVDIIAPGYNVQAKTLTFNLVRISSLNILSMMISAVFNGVLQYKEEYIGANISSVLINLIVIFFMIIKGNISITELVTITVIANFIQILVQIPWLKKCKFKYKYIFRFDSNIKYMLHATIPLLIGTIASELNNIIDKSLASKLSEGSVSALSYSWKIITLPHSIFGYAIVIVLFPYISRVYNDNKENLTKFINSSIIYICIIMIFISVWLIVMNKEIVKLFFGYGNFDSKAITKTSLALIGYSIGLPFLAVRDLLIRILYITSSSKYIMKTTIISVIMNIMLNILLIRYLDIIALALSTSISVILITILNYKKISKICNLKRDNKMLMNIFVIFIVSFLIVMPLKILSTYIIEMGLGLAVVIVMLGLISICIYVFLLIKLQINNMDLVWKKIIRREKKVWKNI